MVDPERDEPGAPSLPPLEVLVAEDDTSSRLRLEAIIRKWGFRVLVAREGEEALRLFEAAKPPIAILDWLMPGISGIELCRRIKDSASGCYVILLTVLSSSDDVVAGLEAGADDYIKKPVHRGELRARIRVGERVRRLQFDLERRVAELERALAQVKQLRGLLPICSYCKKVRDDRDYWHQLESYISSHTDARFSHGICPECLDRVRSEFRPKGRRGEGT